MAGPECFGTKDLLCDVRVEAATGSLNGVPMLAMWVDKDDDPLLIERSYIFHLLRNWDAKTSLAKGVAPAEEYKEGAGQTLKLGFDTLPSGRRVVSLYRGEKLQAGIPLELLVIPFT